VRFILIPQPANLPAHWPKISSGRVAKVSSFATHELRAKYIREYGSWGLLKKWLANASGQKCWYCEGKSTRAPFDVDHYRPKLGITVDGVKLVGHDGYYWLAYEWTNLRLSCQRCNRPENDDSDILRGKANEFPIQDETQRCTLPSSSLTTEVPRLLDPCVETDCELLAHGIDGEVKPASSTGTWEYQRADYTINRLGLNNWNTPENKRCQWQTLATLLSVVGDKMYPAVVAELNKRLSHEYEYSRFFRAAIGTHRDKAWVEVLL
jgi:uncharacterized protein (TIGR02646 family)